MKILRATALTAALLSLALTSAHPQGTLLVANQKDHTLSVIDTATAKQIAAIPEDRITGHEVATSPDGRTAYLPIYGSGGVDRAGTDGQEMLVIDIPTRKITATVDFGHPVRPHMPLYDGRRNLLYVSTELDQAITIIDPKTLKIVGKIPTGAIQSHMFALSHDGKLAYVTNVGASSISVLDLDTRKLIATIPTDEPGKTRTQRISLTNDDKLLFTSDWDRPRLAVIDTTTRKLKQWIPLPGTGYGSVSTHDGRYLILCIANASKMAIIDLATLTVVRSIDVPAQPQEVLLRPDGRVAYVSCNSDHKVAAISVDGPVATWKVQSLIDAGNGADGLAWLPTPASPSGSH